MLIRVEIGGLAISSEPEDTLISYALGSCAGVAMYDPVAKIGGLIHAKLPVARDTRPELVRGPAICADVGTMRLLQSMYEAGAVKSRLLISVAGCANPVKAITHDIGARNYTIVRKVLWKNGLLIHAEDVGGEKPRTISLNLSNGEINISSLGETVRIA